MVNQGVSPSALASKAGFSTGAVKKRARQFVAPTSMKKEPVLPARTDLSRHARHAVSGVRIQIWRNARFALLPALKQDQPMQRAEHAPLGI